MLRPGLASLLIPLLVGVLPLCAQQTNPSVSGFTLKMQSDLVLTDIVVRDRKTGEPVRGLKRSDFTILENGKPQALTTFDTQDVDQALQLPSTQTITGHAAMSAAKALGQTAAQQSQALRDHRLIVLFFDTTSMQPDDLDRVQTAAQHFINSRMQSADLVSVVSLGNTLSLDQDFTADKTLLLRAIGKYAGGSGQGYVPGSTSTTNQVEDTTAFTADESEYNDLNTDRELYAITSIAEALAPINQKKSLLYFSGGIQRDGIENQASLRSAINTAVRSNLSIYSVDARGLQAISPLGDATTGSIRGNAAYTGGATQNNLDSNFNSQEVMSTLSADTGGKAFFDNNDLAPAFAQVQNDTASYYVLGFHSTDTARDGRYRKLEIRVDRPDVKLSYRAGYYAPADYRHSTGEQREHDLEAELNSDLPATDLSVYLQPFFFRDTTGRYNMPVILLVPGAQIPFTQGGDRDKATLDIIGNIKDAQGHVLQQVRDTVKLAIDTAKQVTRKNIQYATGFTLPAGKYHVKFVVRENETGKLGSFEADIRVPDLAKEPLKISSLVLASQLTLPSHAAEVAQNPLIYQGQQYIPNLPHVFYQDQPLYFFYEVYDPATAQKDPRPGAVKASGMHLLTSIELLRNNVKVYQSPQVVATRLNIAERDAVGFAFTVPLTSLVAGEYTCQVNVIDDTGATFAFPRTPIFIRKNAQPAPPIASPAASPPSPTR